MQDEQQLETIQPTALLHEAYLRLSQHRRGWQSESEFRAAAVITLRRVLIDEARARRAFKRGGGATRVVLHLDSLSQGSPTIDPIELDEALQELETLSPLQAQVVQLRAMAGLTVAETATVLNVSERQVTLKWKTGRAWLMARLTHPGEEHD